MSSALTVKEVAERYGVGERTIIGFIRPGELQAFDVRRKLGSSRPRWRITQEALETFEALRTTSPGATPLRRRKRRPHNVIEFYK